MPDTAKRACQRCEYLNPRQALYCLRCGEIFRPVLAETPWEYLRPEREQLKAEVLGKAALQTLRRLSPGPAWHRVGLATVVLSAAFALAFQWNVRRVLSRTLAGEPAVVAQAVWAVHDPPVDRSRKPLIRPTPALRTVRDPIAAAWIVAVWPIALYLVGLGLAGLARRELAQARFVSAVDPFYPMGRAWGDLIAGRSSRASPGRPLSGAPAALVSAAYIVWGLATMFVVPGAVYTGELRLEGMKKGLKALGLEPPSDSRIAKQGLWADEDGTLRVLVESGLDRGPALEHYRAAASAPGALWRSEGNTVTALRPNGSRFYAVSLDSPPAQRARGIRSVLYLSLSAPERLVAVSPPGGGGSPAVPTSTALQESRPATPSP